MALALIQISSAQGDREGFLAQAIERLGYGNELKSISNVYEAFGDSVRAGTPKFLSACVVIETDMTPAQLLRFLIETENQLERTRSEGPSPGYTVDLDLVLFENETLRTPSLTLPHPAAHQRPYVVVPAAEIAAEWQHPVLNKTIGELAQEAQAENPGWGVFFLRGEKLRVAF